MYNRKPHSGSEFISLFVVAVLIFVCVPVHADGINKQLRKAAKRGDVTAIQDLLEDGANIETKNRKGYSPLHIAVIKGKLKAVETLIKAGADVNNISSIGSTPLISAAYRSYTTIVQALMAAGADIKPESDNGNTALDLALKYDCRGCAELIKVGDLAYAVNIAMPKSRGLTAVKFRTASTRALRGRGWMVIQETDDRIDAQLVKRGRIFKVVVQKNSDHIAIRYLPYYGARKLNYLINIQRDMKPLL